MAIPPRPPSPAWRAQRRHETAGPVMQVWGRLKDRLAWLASRTRLKGLSRFKRWCVMVAAGVVLLLGLALAATWDDIVWSGLYPREPFQTYDFPKIPDYSLTSAWALNPMGQPARRQPGPVDVFFVHPTTFNGGRNLNGAVDDREAARLL